MIPEILRKKTAVMAMLLAGVCVMNIYADQVAVDFGAPGIESRVKMNGREGVTYSFVDGAKGKAVEIVCSVAKNGSPGIAITPENGVFDFSSAGRLEVDVTNLSDERIAVFVRADNKGNAPGGSSNTEQAVLAPGKSGTVKLIFGFSYGAKGFALDAGNITQILVFSGKAKKETKWRIDAMRLAGKPGEKPAGYAEKTVPKDGALLSFGADGIKESAILSRGAKTTLSAGGAEVSFAGSAPAQVTFKAPDGVYWDLSHFNQVEFSLKNTGTSPATLTCRLDNKNASPKDHSISVDVTLNAGESKVITAPFAGVALWDGNNPKISGSRIDSDSVVAVSLLADKPQAGQKILLTGVRCSVAPAAELPDWLGKRPPVEGNWKQTLNENFDGNTLNSAIWELPEKPSGSIWDKKSVQCAENAYVENGMLKIKCEKPEGGLKIDDPAVKDRNYFTSVVTSFGKFTQKYGYFESRMKLPQTLGMWPAFWMMPDRGAQEGVWWKRQRTNDRGMEFDIMEHLVRYGPYRYNIAMHWDGYGKDHKATGTENIYFSPDKDGFVTSGLLWEPRKLSYYCQGKLVGVWENERIMDLPGYILYTMPVGGWGTNGVVDDAKLPAYFEIDYVRVWQKE